MFTIDQLEKIKKISDYFTLEQRFEKLKEENVELYDAFECDSIPDIKEESVDNLIVLMTILYKDDLNNIINFKLDRTIKQIKEGVI